MVPGKHFRGKHVPKYRPSDDTNPRPHFSFIDKGVDRTRPASNGLNPAQVPFSLTNNQTVLRVKISRHRGAKEGGQLRLHTCTLLACYP